jgi:hypothetical protein
MIDPIPEELSELETMVTAMCATAKVATDANARIAELEQELEKAAGLLRATKHWDIDPQAEDERIDAFLAAHPPSL